MVKKWCWLQGFTVPHRTAYRSHRCYLTNVTSASCSVDTFTLCGICHRVKMNDEERLLPESDEGEDTGLPSESSLSQRREYISARNLASLSLFALGLAFMMIFAAFNTTNNMAQVVIDSIQKEDPSFKGSGYVSLAVIYATFATCNWLAPSALSFLGPKLTMIIGGITYVIFIGCFLYPQTWLLYLTSVLVGAGAALIWTGQGNYLTLMSDKETMARNSGIFWAMLQSSFLFGNLFVFYQFEGQEIIGADTRLIVFSILTGVGTLGVLTMLLLPKPGASAGAGREDKIGSPGQALKDSFALFRTYEMMLLAVTFFYTGLELSFFSGVYSACISFTLRFDDPKKLVGLSGIFIGCGEILGGAIFGIFGKKTIKAGRDPIILLGYLVHCVCFFLIFMNLPSKAPLGDTMDASYFAYGVPSEVVAMLCSFLLGFGDACYNTQIYSLLGSVYADRSGPAFALFKFTQSLAAAACFFYASVLELNWHLLILVISGTMGTLTFCLVEWKEFAKTNRSSKVETEVAKVPPPSPPTVSKEISRSSGHAAEGSHRL